MPVGFLPNKGDCCFREAIDCEGGCRLKPNDGLLLEVHDYADVYHFGGRTRAALGSLSALTRQSVSVVSAACALSNPQVTIAMRAMTREHVRSMEKPNQSNPCNNVPHSWGADYPRRQLLANAAIAASRVAA